MAKHMFAMDLLNIQVPHSHESMEVESMVPWKTNKVIVSRPKYLCKYERKSLSSYQRLPKSINLY